jgi:hypothetical protein
VAQVAHSTQADQRTKPESFNIRIEVRSSVKPDDVLVSHPKGVVPISRGPEQLTGWLHEERHLNTDLKLMNSNTISIVDIMVFVDYHFWGFESLE